MCKAWRILFGKEHNGEAFPTKVVDRRQDPSSSSVKGTNHRKSEAKLLREKVKRRKKKLARKEEMWNDRDGPIGRDSAYCQYKAEYDRLAEDADRVSHERGVSFKNSQGEWQDKRKQNLVEIAISVYSRKLQFHDGSDSASPRST